MSLTLQSSRFGAVDLDDGAAIEFPSGLIGLPGTRWALVAPADAASEFRWLHSLEDPDVALPVVPPWSFFADYEVVLSDAETERVGLGGADGAQVYVTVRAAADLAAFTVNLRAPIVVHDGRGHQVINELPGAQVRTPLFPAVDDAPDGAPAASSVR